MIWCVLYKGFYGSSSSVVKYISHRHMMNASCFPGVSWNLNGERRYQVTGMCNFFFLSSHVIHPLLIRKCAECFHANLPASKQHSVKGLWIHNMYSHNINQITKIWNENVKACVVVVVGISDIQIYLRMSRKLRNDHMLMPSNSYPTQLCNSWYTKISFVIVMTG